MHEFSHFFECHGELLSPLAWPSLGSLLWDDSCGTTSCGTTPCGSTSYGTTPCGLTSCGKASHGLTPCGITCHGTLETIIIIVNSTVITSVSIILCINNSFPLLER